MSKDDKLIKAALEVYRMELAGGAHKQGSRADREWCERTHDEVLDLLKRRFDR